MNVFLVEFLTSAAAAGLQNICINAIKCEKNIRGITYYQCVLDRVYYRK